jgi:hypothetical protein
MGVGERNRASTAYLENGGKIERACHMAAVASTRANLAL